MFFCVRDKRKTTQTSPRGLRRILPTECCIQNVYLFRRQIYIYIFTYFFLIAALLWWWPLICDTAFVIILMVLSKAWCWLGKQTNGSSNLDHKLFVVCFVDHKFFDFFWAMTFVNWRLADFGGDPDCAVTVLRCLKVHLWDLKFCTLLVFFFFELRHFKHFSKFLGYLQTISIT